VNQAENRVVRETVEVLGAEDELRREERPHRRIGDPAEQRFDVLRPRDHGAILRRPERAFDTPAGEA
jgi:hypothetical protein